MPRLCPSNQHGFTLTELMIVIVIVGTLAGLTVANYVRQLPTSRLNGAARHVLTDLMLARRQALSQNQRVKVYFPEDEQYDRYYKICSDANGDGTVTDCEGNNKTTNIQTSYAGVTLSANRDPVFHPNGTVYSLHEIASPVTTITLTNTRGATREITVSRAGRIRVKSE